MFALLVPLRRWLSSHGIPFMRLRFLSLGVAAAIVLVSALVSLGVIGSGLNYGIDFEGGVLVEIALQEGKTVADLRSIGEFYPNKDLVVQPLSGGALQNLYLLKLELGEGDAGELLSSLRKNLTGIAEDIRRSELVGPTISGELREQAIFAFFWALLGILAYIWWRFQWRFAMVAVAALLHDIIAIIGFYALTGFEINIATVAVVLTVAGYSINDTVVILDRIRENMGRYKTTHLWVVFEQSINETLGRTLMTSVTTLVALLATVALGSGIVQEFAASLIWGVIIGTFSSIGLAVPLLSLLHVNRGLDFDTS